eukprot:5131439-Pleurochrysis_carterae.AAC.1
MISCGKRPCSYAPYAMSPAAAPLPGQGWRGGLEDADGAVELLPNDAKLLANDAKLQQRFARPSRPLLDPAVDREGNGVRGLELVARAAAAPGEVDCWVEDGGSRGGNLESDGDVSVLMAAVAEPFLHELEGRVGVVYVREGCRARQVL